MKATIALTNKEKVTLNNVVGINILDKDVYHDNPAYIVGVRDPKDGKETTSIFFLSNVSYITTVGNPEENKNEN